MRQAYLTVYGGQADEEAGAIFERAKSNRTVLSFDERLANEEPEPGAFDQLRVLPLDETFEQLPAQLFGHAAGMIPNLNLPGVITCGGAYGNRVSFRRVLDRIGQQVDEDLNQAVLKFRTTHLTTIRLSRLLRR